MAVGAYRKDEQVGESGSVYMYKADPGGETWTHEMRLVAEDSVPNDMYGRTVAINDRYLAVAAEGEHSGSVYTYLVIENTTYNQKLSPADGVEGQQFGAALAMTTLHLTVGSPADHARGTEAGAAYVYAELDDHVWAFNQKILPPPHSDAIRFGSAIAMSIADLAIGAPGVAEPGHAYAGAVHMYSRYRSDGSRDECGATWQLVQVLVPPAVGNKGREKGGAPYDFYGSAVAIFGDRLAVGSHGDGNWYDTDMGQNSGSVYMYQWKEGAGWMFEQKLRTSDDHINRPDRWLWDQWFGRRLSMTEGHLVVGVEGDDDTATHPGTMYLYTLHCGLWNFTLKVTANDGELYDKFGTAVASTPESIAIGASGVPRGKEGFINRPRSSLGAIYYYKMTKEDLVCPAPPPSPPPLLASPPPPAFQYALNATATRLSIMNTEVKMRGSNSSGIDDLFGRSVALTSTHLAVGAYRDVDGDESGSVYVFTVPTPTAGPWDFAARLLPLNGRIADGYGSTVALSTNTLAVSAPDDGAGKVYMYTLTDSASEPVAFNHLLEGTDDGSEAAMPGQQFGRSVSITSLAMAVGAPADSEMGWDVGAVYLYYELDGFRWTYDQTLRPPDASPGIQFGSAVVMTLEHLAVGAPGTPTPGYDYPGAVYMYRLIGVDGTKCGVRWRLFQKLEPPVLGCCGREKYGEAYDFFGSSVAIFGDRLAVGSHGDGNWYDTDMGQNSGSVYIYKFVGEQWVFDQKLMTSDDGIKRDTGVDRFTWDQYFGQTLAMTKDHIVIGATGDDDHGTAPGSVYMYTLTEDDRFNFTLKVTANDGNSYNRYDHYGRAVALTDTNMAAGASGVLTATEGYINRKRSSLGAMYVYAIP